MKILTTKNEIVDYVLNSFSESKIYKIECSAYIGSYLTDQSLYRSIEINLMKEPFLIGSIFHPTSKINFEIYIFQN